MAKFRAGPVGAVDVELLLLHQAPQAAIRIELPGGLVLAQHAQREALKELRQGAAEAQMLHVLIASTEQIAQGESIFRRQIKEPTRLEHPGHLPHESPLHRFW